MAFEDKITKESNNEEYIQVITDASETIASCGGDVQIAAENIMLSCSTPGTKGEANKDMLLAKADDMKKLTVLYKSASKQLLNAAGSIEDGKLNDKALSKVLAYGLFLVDQLKCEEEEAHNVLRKLREENSNISQVEGP